MHLILIGMRGSGKTTIGRLVAHSLNRQPIDIDERIASQSGETIAQIFLTRGEAAFRDLETAAIGQALSEAAAVISVGGGAILSEGNRERLRRAGFCIWLRASLQTLADRIAADPITPSQRPSLIGVPFHAELQLLLAAREPLYRQTAHAIVDADSHFPDQVCARVIRAFTNPDPA